MNSMRDPLQFAQLGHLRLAYRQVGSGPPLVLMHGAEADHSMFDALVAELAADFTLIAYDQRDSGATQHAASRYELAELADDAAGLIRHLGLARAHVFGTSFGGTIAQVLSARHPAVVERLILSSTWRVGRRIADFNPQVARQLTRLRANASTHAAEIAAYFFTAPHIQASPKVIEMFRSASRTDEQKAKRAHAQAHPPAVDFAALTAPTLLVAGSADRLIPADITFEIGQHIANSEQALLNGLPHVGVLEDPVKVASCIRQFLAA